MPSTGSRREIDVDKRDNLDYLYGVNAYFLREVPSDLWRKVKAKAALEGVTVREVIIRLLREYVNGR